jgi:hypothetical protein
MRPFDRTTDTRYRLLRRTIHLVRPPVHSSTSTLNRVFDGAPEEAKQETVIAKSFAPELPHEVASQTRSR